LTRCHTWKHGITPERRGTGIEAVDSIDQRGEIAQLVEHTTENRGVLGSIPSLAISEDACMWAVFREVGEAI
jgi:hypothetical protein